MWLFERFLNSENIKLIRESIASNTRIKRHHHSKSFTELHARTDCHYWSFLCMQLGNANFILAEVTLRVVPTIKYLEIHISSDLSWNESTLR